MRLMLRFIRVMSTRAAGVESCCIVDPADSCRSIGHAALRLVKYTAINR
jgi:hypothetical protein